MLFLVFTFTEVKHIFSLKSKSIIDLHKWVTVCVIAFVVVDTQMEIMLQGIQINWKKFNAENKLANQGDCVNSFCYPFYCQMRVIHRMAANYQFSDVFSIILMSKISVNLICRISGYYTVCAVHSDYRCFLILEFIFSLKYNVFKSIE